MMTSHQLAVELELELLALITEAESRLAWACTNEDIYRAYARVKKLRALYDGVQQFLI